MSVRPWIPNRSSKRVEAPPAEEITVATEVPPPNEIPEVVPPNKFQKLLPLLMGVAIIGMIGIFLSMGIRRMSPMMLMFPLMFLMAAGGMVCVVPLPPPTSSSCKSIDVSSSSGNAA